MPRASKHMLSAALLLFICIFAQAASTPKELHKPCKSKTASDDCNELACVNGFCSFCGGWRQSNDTITTTQEEADAQCAVGRNSQSVCNKEGKGLCQHKKLWPLDSLDWVTIALVIIACILAASGGIGGGGLLVPLYILVSGFAANRASPMSSATITGGAIANYYSYCQRLHPHFDRGISKTLIDYDAALVIMPSLLLGTLYGTIFNKIFPEWLFLALMFILMIRYTVRTTQKGRRLWKKETEERERPDDQQKLLETEAGAPSAAGPRPARFPRYQIGVTLVAWVLTFLISLFKGKKGTKSVVSISCGTGGYWAVIVVGSLALAALSYYIRNGILRQVKSGTITGDIKWDEKNTITYPLICVICGIMAGLMGIGGGMVVGPLLIELGVVPQVVAATSAYTVLITASSATVQFIIMKTLQLDYAICFAIIGLLATFAGQYVVDSCIKKYNRASVIIFAIATIMAIATVLLGYTGIDKIVVQAQNHASFGFRPLC